MPTAVEPSQKYILGLDLGSASIGWAVILLNQAEEPCKLLAAGSHIFDPGVEKPPAAPTMGQDELILRGLDRSKAAGRRIARQLRRQIDRRSLRVKKLFKLLQSKELLPNYADLKSMTLADERFHLFTRLDELLSKDLALAHRRRGAEPVMVAADQALPYVLRKEALERKLTEWELGRALYHLCQRRGYRSGQAIDDDDKADTATAEASAKKSRQKKTVAEDDDKKDDSSGKVEADIRDLHAKMDAAHAPTYGAYFANTLENDPHKQRIRDRWTSRDKYIEEFKLIWDKQREFYRAPETDPVKEETRKRLSDLLDGTDLRQQVYDCLFYQRPLASAAHLIGRCELIPEARRAPWATLEAQRFRLLQKVADLAYLPPEQVIEQKLKPEQQAVLAHALETRGDMTFAQIAELLDLPPKTTFNLPRDKKEQAKKKIIGNRINTLMLRIFGDRWIDELTEDQQHKAVSMWAASGDREARIEQAKSVWNLQETAAIWADERPPKDYCKFSIAALRQLIKGMEQGIHWTTTAAEMRDRLAPRDPVQFVPPVVKALPAITNPAVLRALTELRKVVNAIIRAHGRPHEIRIELARELRKNRKQRHDTHEANEKNNAKRMEAAEKILKECRDYEYKSFPAERLVRERRDDVTRMLLLMECQCHCPYTGDPISYQKLFSGEVEVEHIIPVSLMVDNDFNNLTLCYRRVNAEKLNRTPWDAFGPHKGADRWAQIIERVKKFDNKAKLARFEMSSLDQVKAFASRRLNDTRYTSKLAGRLLMTLYADRDPESVSKDDPLDEFRDRSGRRPIKVSSGMETHLLRDAWQLRLGNIIEDAFTCPNKALEKDSGKKQPKRPPKDRCDHRHHAVDAVVIALTSDKVIHEINTLAGTLYSKYQRPLTYRDLRSVQSPWPNFIDEDFKNIFRGMTVSRRPEHKLSGALHQETFYPKLRPEDGARHQRISVDKFSKAADEKAEMKLIDKIVDEDIKQAVLRFRKDKIGTFKKWNVERDGWPQLDRRRNGEPLPKANIRDIKKVRIGINKPALDKKGPLGKSKTERYWRYVEEGDIAYVSFFTLQDQRGTKWEADFVKLFKAVQRVREFRKADRSIEKICRTHSDSTYATATFRFSLMKGDLIELLHNGKKGIFVVRRFESDGRFWVAPINAAGRDEDMKATQSLLRVNSVSAFTKMWVDKDIPRPMFVDLLGKPYGIKVYA
jgi:CRISPR-associated endonuclease Csn1